ncbi:hypothetical protein INQ41_11905 [Lysobacter ciconiae]|uniref:DUF1269 domain-containing protein n=1 Tax=Novilysobacter ciconiae TaxID=2781022 RepID=A0A7S6UFG0_9GAMM|nr:MULTISPECIES: hypothetical protein [Lysobacter]QOW19312.1 hypothetical protein INQ41_11905 [Lysobacter ciconiae]QOY62525.1 hypothetical protein INQ40_11650 [Lysobacter sp. H21R4]
MTARYVFSTPDISAAAEAMAAARAAGVEDDRILLVARSDIELGQIPDQRKEAETDMLPAAARGVGLGAGAGLLAGLAAVAIPPLGITLAGAAAATLVGAAAGGWAAALFGSAMPDPVRQKFEDRIEAGEILVVIDGDPETLEAATRGIVNAGGERLPF